MMTVLTRTRVPRDKRPETSPRWIEDPTYPTPGSAKPGRGGRRKRRRRAAGVRAFNLYCRAHRLSKATGAALLTSWRAIALRARRLLPLSVPDPSYPGRRERRRRAKLRRRRAWTEIRRAARAMLLAMPIIYRPASTEAMRREVNRVALRQRAAMKRHAPWILGASPTPGA
jgi:hypothetical protein